MITNSLHDMVRFLDVRRLESNLLYGLLYTVLSRKGTPRAHLRRIDALDHRPQLLLILVAVVAG